MHPNPLHPRANFHLPSASTDSSLLSGPRWVTRYPPIKSLDALGKGFRDSVEAFLAALKTDENIKTGHLTVSINETYRPPAKSYLMYYAYWIWKGVYDPASIPPGPVAIRWDHPTRQASIEAAKQMAIGWGIVYPPARRSRHNLGTAIDMTIRWTGNLVVKVGDKKQVVAGGRKYGEGDEVLIRTEPKNGDNADLQEVGASYGVIKLRSDPPHWSDSGK